MKRTCFAWDNSTSLKHDIIACLNIREKELGTRQTLKNKRQKEKNKKQKDKNLSTYRTLRDTLHLPSPPKLPALPTVHCTPTAFYALPITHTRTHMHMHLIISVTIHSMIV